MIKKITKRDWTKANKLLQCFDYQLDEKIYNNPYIHIIMDDDIGVLIYDKIYQRIEIEYIIVNKNYRNRGIATKLLNYMIKTNPDIENITLEIRESNDIAISFYLKNGFIKVANRENYYKNEKAILMMRKFDKDEK